MDLECARAGSACDRILDIMDQRRRCQCRDIIAETECCRCLGIRIKAGGQLKTAGRRQTGERKSRISANRCPCNIDCAGLEI